MSLNKLSFEGTNERCKFRVGTENCAVITVVPLIVDLFNVHVGKPNGMRKIAIT